MYINQSQVNHMAILENRQFFDTELPIELTQPQLDKLVAISEDAAAVQVYLKQAYDLLRQGAGTDQLEIPACLGEAGESRELPEQPPRKPDSAVLSKEASERRSEVQESGTDMNPETE